MLTKKLIDAIWMESRKPGMQTGNKNRVHRINSSLHQLLNDAPVSEKMYSESYGLY
jgi:hypothetical protein